jgi:CBS domain-containing protein
MTRDIICVGPDASLREVYDIMRLAGVRHVPVVDERRLLGIVSDRDILPFTEHGALSEDHSVAEVMSEYPIVAGQKTPIARIAQHMLEHKIDAIPVVKGAQLVGLVTVTDMIALMLAPLDPAAELPFEFHVLPAQSFKKLRTANASVTNW